MKSISLRLVLSLATLALLVVPGAASAATQFGQLAPQGAGLSCTANSGHAPSTLASGQPNPYTVPDGGGVITEWRTRAGAGGGSLALQALAQDQMNNGTYTVLAESRVETPTASTVNTFKTRLPVAGGEVLGLRVVAGSPDCRYTGATGITEWSITPAPQPNSGPVAYPTGTGDTAINARATLEPDKDGDGFGDETQDGCPSKGQRQDDCVPPSVAINKAPKKKTKRAKARFRFSSDDPQATFECSLDGKRFKPCASPFVTRKLKRGRHTFEVRATDRNDNASEVAAYKWKVKKKRR